MFKRYYHLQNMRELFLVFELNLDLVLTSQLFYPHIGIEHLTQYAGRLLIRLWRDRSSRLWLISD